MTSSTKEPVEVFFSYAPADSGLRDALAKHLDLLRRQEVIRAWHQEMIAPGEDWRPAIRERLDAADLILILVSADYHASDDCFDLQMKRALERREKEGAIV